MTKICTLAAPAFALILIGSTAVVSSAATTGEAHASGLPSHHSEWTGQTLTTKNGAKITTLGSKLTIATADGKSTVIDRSDPQFVNQKMPVAVPMTSCAKLEEYIKLYPLTDMSWRRAVVAYSNRCL